MYKQCAATSSEPLGCAVSLSLCIGPSLPRPPAGGPRSQELALDAFEARSTLPSATCSMSQEPYDTTQQVSQPTSVPKNNFDPGEKQLVRLATEHREVIQKYRCRVF